MAKDWQKQRRNETTREWQARLNRTCFACGYEARNTAKCNEHEKECDKARKSGRKR